MRFTTLTIPHSLALSCRFPRRSKFMIIPKEIGNTLKYAKKCRSTRVCYRTCFEGETCKAFTAHSSPQPLRLINGSEFNFQTVFSPRDRNGFYRKSTNCRCVITIVTHGGLLRIVPLLAWVALSIEIEHVFSMTIFIQKMFVKVAIYTILFVFYENGKYKQ